MESLVVAKTSTLEFYPILNNVPVFGFSVDLYSTITSMVVIPSRHKRPDAIFVSDDLNRFTIFRPNSSHQLDILLKRSCEFESVSSRYERQGLNEVDYGVQYRFNANDTEGFLYYRFGREMMVMGFAEKLEGFKELNNSAFSFEKEIISVTSVPKAKSKYKKDTLAVVSND